MDCKAVRALASGALVGKVRKLVFLEGEWQHRGHLTHDFMPQASAIQLGTESAPPQSLLLWVSVFMIVLRQHGASSPKPVKFHAIPWRMLVRAASF